MADKQTRHIAELALIISVPGVCMDTLKPSKLKNRMERLWIETVKDLGLLPTDNNFEIESLIQKFGEESGWEGRSQHIGTRLSFCADMIERSENSFNPKILEAINDLIAHLENGKKLKQPSCWAGSLAADKWENLFKVTGKTIN